MKIFVYLLACLLFAFVAAPLHAEGCASILGSLFSHKEYALFSKSQSGEQEVGKGQVLTAGPARLEFQYTVTSGAVKPQGRVRVDFVQGCRFRLTVSGIPGRGPVTELVDADTLFVGVGMLHFYFDQRRRFFQIDRKGSETRMVTEYGPLLFRPTKP